MDYYELTRNQDADDERIKQLEITNADLVEAIEWVILCIDDANKPVSNYRLRMCVASETILPYLKRVSAKTK